jgi:uncharacterized protein
VIAGARDRIVPADLSRAVARSADAEYMEVDSADHNDPVLLAGAPFLDRIDAFLSASVTGP